MRAWICLFLLATIPATGCKTFCAHAGRSANLNPAEAATVVAGVRAFASDVAGDVTRRGPAAWRTHFADSPAFFMAAGGDLVYANGAAATDGIKELEKTIQHIELTWGDSLRVDPLTPSLAMMAAPWHEILVYSSGSRVDAKGFFTGLVERGPAGWQFRNAHWSVAGPPAAVR